MSAENPNPSTGLPAALLELARRAAAAGAAVLAGRNAAELDVSNKGDAGDWVTAFDLAAERAVREVISTARPFDTITGEEGGTVLPPSPSGYRWSIDPLDGTANFIRNIVYYGTSVAVADPHGVWLAGVVDAPALGRRYYALRGHGAWLEEAGRLTPLAGPLPGRSGQILATGFSYDPAVRAEQASGLGSIMDGFADVRRLGSAALDLCLVADGTHDAYGERGLNEHDFAAGALIAEEAGCWVRRPRLTSPLAGGPSDDERLAAWTCAGTLELSGKFPL
ncbi:MULTISPECIES: inositol monophosphatase family protein [unclassified Arthrobacter]|uniref:inositol monophosphatase family protein n=1 Tax=unclassified Arthrobacter TaxID=235627 RepID=UPI001CFFD0AC|nr:MULTISPECIES: inositol monophosphatase family protein [unclassified Arthrobacter]MCB5281994.1 Inositol-1-monophosphatase [Arthrobacter sp. ES1]WGZ80328.1 inositol monophosphatase family protein [Arthrobacter sp. EM1]